mmetsp:Transcript_7142/g.15479  ORF Transcript_7142/g.15479 Transcript_7142/m.15479 type:complete len:108 (-) Transcript_7142:289-612(-)|eukprot:CAMPEP_0196152616 /NCGR_PEP_ID=MMETSP0910-20130528/35782_1 /TAXON_ID=49265 /ORGANISM="Thalassiosira rotula, Strain GSO102" /LENGTH=107 /DNA_ID=CAMNT_0041416243 /DNA_START=194 /DNA_END=517 /DNA_ORIENTATION=-
MPLANNGQRGRTNITSPTTIPSALTRQCLQLHHPNQRISNDAIELTSEFLKMFVVEARRRAAIEAECETGVEMIEEEGDTNNKTKEAVEIRADHIAKIAAELLLDLS